MSDDDPFDRIPVPQTNDPIEPIRRVPVGVKIVIRTVTAYYRRLNAWEVTTNAVDDTKLRDGGVRIIQHAGFGAWMEIPDR